MRQAVFKLGVIDVVRGQFTLYGWSRMIVFGAYRCLWHLAIAYGTLNGYANGRHHCVIYARVTTCTNRTPLSYYPGLPKNLAAVKRPMRAAKYG